MAATKACHTTMQTNRAAEKVGPAPLVVHGFATVWMLATFPHLLFFTDWVEMAQATLREEEAVGQARQVKFTPQGWGRVVTAAMVSSLTSAEHPRIMAAAAAVSEDSSLDLVAWVEAVMVE